MTVMSNSPLLRTGTASGRRRRRAGAILSAELMFVLPIVMAVLFAMVEFAMLLVAQQRVEVAAREACRVASLPTTDAKAAEKAVHEMAARALGSKNLVCAHRLTYKPAKYAGETVAVEIRVPMKAAAPDMLGLVGFGLGGRQLTARCVMRKE